MTDRASIAKLGEPDPEFAEWISKNPLPKADWSDMKQFRAMRAELEKARMRALGPPGPEIEESSKEITMRDGEQTELKIFKPTKKPADGSPLVVLNFGGGFVVGNNQQLTAYSRALVKLFGAVVVNTGYRLAPEHKFPQAPHDVEDSLKWVAKNASSLDADPSKGFLLGGVSAGGNLTACIAQKWKDDDMSPPLTGLWLCVPLVFPNGDLVPEKYKDQWFAHEQNADAPILDKNAVEAIGRHLEPDAQSPLYSPFNSETPHKGLPPSYVSVCGLDPLRDDGLIYEKVLKDNGVETLLHVWPGLPHAHFSFLPFLAGSKKAISDTFEGFAWLLHTSVTPERIRDAMGAPAGA